MKSKRIIILLLFFLLNLIYRTPNLNTFFWVDEFSTAIQGKIYKEIILNQAPEYISIEKNNYFTHFVTALSFIVFGESESSARLPAVFIGSLVPVAIYFLSKKIFNKKVALISSLFVTFSYFEIAWSTQARGYVIQQLFSVLVFYFYFGLFSGKKISIKETIYLLTSIILGMLTHNMFILIPISISIHSLIYYRSQLKNAIIKKPFVAIGLTALVIMTIFISSIYNIILSDLFSLFNNLWYYHALLWREHGIMSLLAIIGLIVGILKKNKETTLFLIFIALQLIFVTFIFEHHMSKYIFPIFHFILLFAGVGIIFISDSIARLLNKKRLSIAIGLGLTFFIILNGHKFVISPKKYYSVNHDMRDIALIDYHQVYQIIQEKSKLQEQPIAIIDTWGDRPKWYLKKDYSDIYLLRWKDGNLRKKTIFLTNSQNEKYIPMSGDPPVRLITELSDLHLAMSKYLKGFIWIDDTSLPADVINYAKENFKEELYLESYPQELLENPYSIWPGTLYSWGFETENPFYL